MDNELIAEFMGGEKTSEVNLRGLPIYIFPDKTTLPLRYTASGKKLTGYLEFNSSWDWLMPVVIKINSFYDSGRPFKPGLPEDTKILIKEKTVKLKSTIWSTSNPSVGKWIRLRKKFNIEKGKEIDAIYNAVVEFIKWYNENKNENR